MKQPVDDAMRWHSFPQQDSGECGSLWGRWAHRVAIAIGVVGFGAMVVGSAPMVGDAAAQSQETPAQRCARQTAEYNQAQEALWRASHPGQQLDGQPWPPYVCADVPSPSVPVSPGGGSGATPGTGQVPGRTHRWDGFGGDQGQYADDMRLGDLGSPHTGLADRMDNRRQSSGAEAAPESARSNVPSRVPRWVSVDDGRGSVRSVRVVDDVRGPMVVDDRGVATGEVVVDDPVLGNRVVSGGAGVAGQQLAGPRRDDAPAASPTERTQPRPSDGMDPSLLSGGEDDEPGIGDAGRGPVAPLGAAGVLAGMAGALVRGRRGREGRGGREVPRVSVQYPWGTQQTLFMLTSPESDRVQRFALDVPEGGRAYVRDDGGVDVVDADGRVVRQVDRPWAFDAAGRPVATHYEVDPDSGDLVQVVEPSDDAVYPIVADPSKNETRTNPVTGQEAIRTDDGQWLVPHERQDGSGRTDWTIQDDEGLHQQSVAGMEWDEDGNPQNIRTIDNSQVDLPQQDRMDWANRTGTNQGDNIDNSLINNDDGTFSDPTQGTTVPGYYNEQTDQRTFDNPDGTSVTEHHRGDGTQNWTRDDPNGQTQEAVSQLDWQDNGSPTNVEQIDNSQTQLPPQDGADDRAWGNATQTQTPVDGQFQDDQGRWHDGARHADGYDTPVYRQTDGTLIGGTANDQGGTDWVATNTQGQQATIRELEWNDNGDPVVRRQDDFAEPDKPNPGYWERVRNNLPLTGASTIQAGMIDTTREGFATQGFTQELPERGRLGIAARAARFGVYGAGAGAALGTAADISGGMDREEAVATNTAGAVAGLVIGAGVTAFAGPLLGFAAGNAASALVTPALQMWWED